jgi:hypothetical protein
MELQSQGWQFFSSFLLKRKVGLDLNPSYPPFTKGGMLKVWQFAE